MIFVANLESVWSSTSNIVFSNLCDQQLQMQLKVKLERLLQDQFEIVKEMRMLKCKTKSLHKIILYFFH